MSENTHEEEDRLAVDVDPRLVLGMFMKNIDASQELDHAQAPVLFALSVLLRTVSLRQLREDEANEADIENLTKTYEEMASSLVKDIEGQYEAREEECDDSETDPG